MVSNTQSFCSTSQSTHIKRLLGYKKLLHLSVSHVAFLKTNLMLSEIQPRPVLVPSTQTAQTSSHVFRANSFLSVEQSSFMLESHE